MSQQIFLPLDGVYPVPYEFEADTMQVPRGQFSILSELENGNVTNAEVIVYLTLNHGSTWQSGGSWCFSTPYLSQLLNKGMGKGMSRRYVRDILNSLTNKGWIETIQTDNPAGYRYQLQHHLCTPDEVPIDEDGKPLKFAVPRGPGGPLERCFEGDISWKAALVWIVLKRRSNWVPGEDTTGQTFQATLHELSKRCRMWLKTFQEILKALEQAGMLQRLTPKSKTAIFQLYPKPYPRPVSRSHPQQRKKQQAKPQAKLEFDGEGYFSDTHYYSRNCQYRCNRETGIIEQRKKNGWHKVSDYHRAQEMNPEILSYFKERLEVKRKLENALFKK